MPSSVRRRIERPLLVILLVALVALVALDRPLARGDGLAYFTWLDSIAGDGDLDLANQAQTFAHVNAYQVYRQEETGAWATDFPYGVGLLLAPAYWLAQLFDRMGWLAVNADYFVGLQGRPLPYSFLGMLAVNLYALVAVALAYLCARRFVRPIPAAAAALALFLGTPMLYYATIEPFYVHVPATFLVVLAFYLLLRWREAEGGAVLALGVGLVGGLATLVRWQAALVVWALALWFPLRRRWRDLALYALGYWAVAWHLLYTWDWMFGQPKVLQATETGFLRLPTHFFDVLFSDGRGLFIWAPLTLLAVVGWVILGRRRRWLAVCLGLAFLLQAFINGGVIDWWGGWSFGMRRMTELYPLFVVGLACLLGWAADRPGWVRWVLWALTMVGLAFSLLLLLSHLNFINTVQEQPQGDRASTEIRYQLTESSFRVTWLVIQDHYGPWAWSRPGP
ncbi:MAG: hypothetical protein PVI59_10480 [Anaerolineae bacterium]|jgi:hypothetical protein